MAGNSFGHLFRVTTWGESHGQGIGVVVDGCPAGLKISVEDIQRELDRRRPGQSTLTTSRREPDRVMILSGLFRGRTTGAPIALWVENLDIDSGKYRELEKVFRPGHADYSYWAKYGLRDHLGGGRPSARETVARVAAGAIAKKILEHDGVQVLGYTWQVGDIQAQRFDPEEIENNPLRCPDEEQAAQMAQLILKVKSQGDSVGGIVGVTATGVPPGLGEPVFDKLDADLAKALMSIGGVKGVEIGAGFGVSLLRGSQNNDPFIFREDGFSTHGNHAGGILGGISTGQELILRLAVKPTPSIALSQQTVNRQGQKQTINIRGRHDPCICPRIVPVTEAMTALVLTDHILRQRSARLNP
jgi:chorismate synthase